MKLYPPAIEGKLPAFAGTSINIPFSFNRAVSVNDLDQDTPLCLRLKTVKTNRDLSTFYGQYIYNKATGSYHANFVLTDKVDLIPGTFYKVQIAFVNKNKEIGYYSSIGIIKCTTYPIIEIPSLTSNYFGNYEYVGSYKQPSNQGNDSTEKAYSYCFELKDIEGNIVSTSGTLIHNSSYDNSTEESHDSWTLRKNLIEGIPYYLTYKVTTMNGLECESPSYPIIAQESVNSTLQDKCDLIAIHNFEDGYIKLVLRPKVKHGIINGSFVLARASSEDNFESWNEIYRFSYKNLHVYGDIGESANLISVHPDFWDRNDLILWEDFTVQQGVKYIYSIQAFNAKGLYSNRMINKKWELDYLDRDMDLNHNYKEPDGYDEYRKGYYYKATDDEVIVDFEDMFLFDGERQLKIRFNPKVTSFKSTVLESKVNTLGGKYPFVFRNGNVEYKEFPIAGLLSLISDPDERFLKGIQTTKLLYRSEATGNEEISAGDTHVTRDNLRREREFKMEALKWLTNGQPKLFRSPSEGNFIVRIMNVSMSPLDVVGRMLHSFSGTAYEIADYNFDNLNKYGFIFAPNRDNRDLKVGQIRLSSLGKGFTLSDATNVINTPAIYQANFTNVPPGTIIGLNFADGFGNIEVEIGSTGSYYVLVKDKPITSITLLKSADQDKIDRSLEQKKPTLVDWRDSYLTFCYYDTNPTDNFSYITNISIQDEFRQFIGINHDINIIDKLEDIRRETGRFHYIRVTERPIQTIYKTDEGWARNPEGTDRIYDSEWDATVIYLYNNQYYDGSPFKPMNPPTYNFVLNNVEQIIHFDGRDIPIGANLDAWWPINQYSQEKINRATGSRGRIDAINGIDKVTQLQGDTGLIIEIAYRVKFMEYEVEDSNLTIINNKNLWQQAIIHWNEVVDKTTSTRADIQEALNLVENTYKFYVNSINQALEEEVERNDL